MSPLLVYEYEPHVRHDLQLRIWSPSPTHRWTDDEVAVGGSIGTGLLLGTAAAIELAGPAVILSFVLAAFISWTVALALGELASTHPAAGSFGVYGDLYLNHWAGFISRAGYWPAIAVSIGAEMVASATYMQLWFPRVGATVWVFVFSAFLLGINFLSVKSYGRFEFWFAMIKVTVIAAFIVLGATLLLTGRAAPQYTAHGGFFPLGPAAPLLAITFAIYTFGGVEFVAVASGESSSAKAIASAVRRTFFTLTFLYLGAIIILVGLCRGTGLAHREPVCHRLSFGEASRRSPFHEFCRSHRCALRSQRGPLHFVAHAVLAGRTGGLRLCSAG